MTTVRKRYGHQMNMDCHCDPTIWALCDVCDYVDDNAADPDCWKCKGAGEYRVALELEADFILHKSTDSTVVHWLETGQIDFEKVEIPNTEDS